MALMAPPPFIFLLLMRQPLVHKSSTRRQNRGGLQQYPLQIARVMDTAASNLLPTGTCKLHPPLIVNMVYMYESKWIRCGKLCDVGPASGLSAYRQPYMGWRSQVPTHFLSINKNL